MNFSRTFHRAVLQLKKHSPEILMAVGVSGTVVSAVMACKATLKVNTILEETKTQVDGIHRVLETPELQEAYKNEYGEEYTKEQSKKDLAITYAQSGIKFVKLYGPSIVLGAASIGCILASGNIMHKRNAALTAAYAAVDRSFKEYRDRVIDRFGNDLDRELRYNIKTERIEEKVKDEKGEEKTVTKTVQTVDPNGIPVYSKFFCEGCKGWDKDPEFNLVYLRNVQRWANERLTRVGHLFLNEVYDALGIDRTREGQEIGWVYDEGNNDLHNFVDFGIYDQDNERKRAFVNGYERNILLDFNVDGVVYDLMQ